MTRSLSSLRQETPAWGRRGGRTYAGPAARRVLSSGFVVHPVAVPGQASLTSMVFSNQWFDRYWSWSFCFIAAYEQAESMVDVGWIWSMFHDHIWIHLVCLFARIYQHAPWNMDSPTDTSTQNWWGSKRQYFSLGQPCCAAEELVPWGFVHQCFGYAPLKALRTIRNWACCQHLNFWTAQVFEAKVDDFRCISCCISVYIYVLLQLNLGANLLPPPGRRFAAPICFARMPPAATWFLLASFEHNWCYDNRCISRTMHH